ncbi:type II toxin-antitoxin system RelE/ParE family toxin [Shewanella sp. 202IG2-18]|uniref:type II toxin-antitoxin system RelE/ParE family toxin n=1 Tax=Parashewanella hymeniacidonis TaxID=2807618 RepID=UPI001960F2BB|nr:type II toxin-antitoxin system RelE/ParE family toxin [Parashewanella hymeniacidonis]MBM7070605.1 type II toxin-antitoxin system RelE/ParE family toxin [Parashewanella hymeniacidonis]
MPNKQYKLSKLAQAHLQKIKSYTIDNFSELQWHKYKEILLSGFQMLAENPELGKSCDDIYANGFYFPVGKHMAYFIKEDGFILIVAVLGQSQLPQKHLK